MIRPLHFSFNDQTAESNSFQNTTKQFDLLSKVQYEFDAVVSLLRSNGVVVLVFEDREDVVTPDSIFPNNWISFESNAVVIYPMMAENRRVERRKDIVDFLTKESIKQPSLFDLSGFEKEGKYLEGTGSLVLDHINKIAYAAISPRTNREVFGFWCVQLNYKPVPFNTVDFKGQAIYHTNVMMAIGTGYAVLGADLIADEMEKNAVIDSLVSTGHELILISDDQLKCFAGNMLEVVNTDGKKFLLMSDAAYKSLSLSQIEVLKKHTEPLICSIPTIELTGGGGVRCMVAEVF